MIHPQELYLVRHAESQANLDESEITAGERTLYPQTIRKERDADVQLTPRGLQQTAATGGYLADHVAPFDVCFVSPWQRTRQTFEQIVSAYPPAQQQALQQRTVFDERLRDREEGILLWLTQPQIAERYPEEAHRRALEGEYYYRPTGGESLADVTQRLASLYETWGRAHAGERILVVTHDKVLVCLRKLFLRLDEHETLRVMRDEKPQNCAVCRFTFVDHAHDRAHPSAPEWRMEQWNTLAYGQDLASTVPEERQQHTQLPDPREQHPSAQ